LGIAKLFDHIQGTDDVPGKPDPAIIFLTCEKLGIDPKQAIFVGDTVMDVLAGLGAGCKTVAVDYGIGKTKDLQAQNPDEIIGTFDRIISYFN